MPKVLFCLQEMCRKQAGKTSAAAEANLDSDADKDIPSAKSPRQSLSKHTSSSDDENDETRSDNLIMSSAAETPCSRGCASENARPSTRQT